MSYTIRLIPFTSLTILVEINSNISQSIFANDAVIASSDSTEKLFIFLDACNSGGMNETLNNTNINHIFMTTTCTENGLGWDVPLFQLGAWTHYFLVEGLNGTGHENWNFTSIYLFSYDEYHTFYGDGGTWEGPTRWDHPMLFNSKPSMPFFL